MILCDHAIEKAIRDGKVIIDPPPDPSQYASSSLDLRVGDDIDAALAAMRGDIPVYVHCHDGVDRTGVACLGYRVLVERFKFGLALGEMIDDGFHLDRYFWWLPVLQRELAS